MNQWKDMTTLALELAFLEGNLTGSSEHRTLEQDTLDDINLELF